MLPPLLSERLIHSFKFWEDGATQQGMRCGIDLYRSVATFAPNESQQAYSLGIALCDRQQQAVLTKAASGYTVWRALQSPEVSHQPIDASKSCVLQHEAEVVCSVDAR